MRYRLLWIEGDDVAEYRDLIGATGEVSRKGKKLTFTPDGRGDWLIMTVASEVLTDEGRWRVTSTFGLTYVFRFV